MAKQRPAKDKDDRVIMHELFNYLFKHIAKRVDKCSNKELKHWLTAQAILEKLADKFYNSNKPRIIEN